MAKPEFSGYTIAGPVLSAGFRARHRGRVRKADTVLKAMLNKAIDEAIADGTIETFAEMAQVRRDAAQVSIALREAD